MSWFKVDPDKGKNILECIEQMKNDKIIDTSKMPQVDVVHMDAYKCVGGMVCAWLKDHQGYNMDCLVKMKLWFPTQENPDITTSLWMADSSDNWLGSWLDDWWEGQTRVEIIGILPLYEVDVPENHHAVWMDEPVFRIIG